MDRLPRLRAVTSTGNDAEPLPILVVRRGGVGDADIGALTSDPRVEAIVVNDLAPAHLGIAQLMAAVVIATTGDPLEAIAYALMVHITAPIVVALASKYRGEQRQIRSLGAAGCITLPVRAAQITKLLDFAASAHAQSRVDRTLRIVLDPVAHQVQYHGKSVTLSQREFALLNCLSVNSGKPVPDFQLLQTVWGSKVSKKAPRQILEVYIFQLRQKLARLGLKSAIKTVRGVGYALASCTDGD